MCTFTLLDAGRQLKVMVTGTITVVITHNSLPHLIAAPFSKCGSFLNWSHVCTEVIVIKSQLQNTLGKQLDALSHQENITGCRDTNCFSYLLVLQLLNSSPQMSPIETTLNCKLTHF